MVITNLNIPPLTISNSPKLVLWWELLHITKITGFTY